MYEANEKLFKYFYVKEYGQNMLFFLPLYPPENPEKMDQCFHLNKTVFNIDNYKKCFLSIKSAHYNDFRRIIWGVMMKI